MNGQPFEVGEVIEYLIHIQPKKWRRAIVISADYSRLPVIYSVKTDKGFVTQQVTSNMRRVENQVMLTWLDILNQTDVVPVEWLDKAEEARLLEIGMKEVRKILAGGNLAWQPFDSSEPDCTVCGERPALQNTQICPECYLNAVNELKPLSQNELNILEADFFNWPRPTELTYADGRNQERREKIEKLRLVMLPLAIGEEKS